MIVDIRKITCFVERTLNFLFNEFSLELIWCVRLILSLQNFFYEVNSEWN